MIQIFERATDCDTDSCAQCHLDEESRSPAEIFCKECQDFLETCFYCAMCGQKESYDGRTPAYSCETCRAPLEDIEDLKTKEIERMKYHIGEAV